MVARDRAWAAGLVGKAVRAAACLVPAFALAGPVGEADQGSYEPYSGIERGTDGVVAVPLRVLNTTQGPLVCAAALAHWYSAPLGTVAPGATLEVTLWHDPADGSLALLNRIEDRMPVERIACRAETGEAAPLPLPFRAGPAPAALERI